VKYVKSQTELAEILGVDRSTVRNHLKRPGNPGRTPSGKYNVPAWAKWMAVAKGSSKGDDLEMRALKIEQARLRAEKADFELSVMKGEKVDISDVEKWTGEMREAASKVLGEIPARLASELVKLSVPAAELKIRTAIDEALERLHAGNWQ